MSTNNIKNLAENQQENVSESENLVTSAENSKPQEKSIDKITIIQASEKLLAKKFTLENDEIVKTDYGNETYFSNRLISVENLREYEKLLHKLESKSKCAIIRGVYHDLNVIDQLENARLLSASSHPSDKDPLYKTELFPTADGRTETHNFFQRRKTLVLDAPHHFVCMDIDKYTIDGKKLELTEESITEFIDHFITNELGDEFLAASYVYQLSASCGMPGRENALSCHVWFWTEQKFDGFFWKAWFKSRKQVLGRRCKVDPSLFRVVSVHYTAAPKFGKGVEDPILKAGISRIGFVEKLEDEVFITNIREIEEAAENDRVNYELAQDGDVEEREDAFTRKGVIGAFNRTYTISTVINSFLSDTFRVDDMAGRVTYLLSDSGAAGGCRIYAGNTKLWNGHNSDPLENRLATAFDLVCYYVCDGDFREALAWCREQPGVTEAEAAGDYVAQSLIGNIVPSSESHVTGVVEELENKIDQYYDNPKRIEYCEMRPGLAARDIARCLAEGRKIFAQTGGYVRVKRRENDEPAKACEVTSKRMELLASDEGISLYRLIGKKAEPIPAPDRVFALAVASEGEEAKPLRAIVALPQFREDGSIADDGYDDETGVFCDLGEEWEGFAESVPLSPTHADIEKAKAIIRDEFCQEFPFDSDEDRAAAYGAIHTQVVRASLPIAPGFVADAAKPGSGKTTLLEMIVTLGRGTEAAAVEWHEEQEENDKQFLAAMRSSGGVSFDNHPEKQAIRSNTLARVLTSGRFATRMFHTQEYAEVPTRVFVGISGNNLRAEGDLASRLCFIRLAPPGEATERTFSRASPKNWVLENRRRIAWACHVILRGSSTAPEGAKPTRFPEWDRRVRYPVWNAFGFDPAATLKANREEDPEAEARADFFSSLAKAKGEERFAASDLLAEMETEPDKAGDRWPTPMHHKVFAAGFYLPDGAKLNVKRIGRFLRGLHGHEAGGFKLQKEWEGNKKVWTYYLEKQKDKPSS